MTAYNKTELVEKWEQSGLLTGALRKEELAQTLESSAAWIMEFVEKDDMKKVNTAASIVLPTVRRVLGEKDFTFQHFVDHVFQNSEADRPIIGFKQEKELVLWNDVLTDNSEVSENLQLAACEKLETAFKEKLSKYNNLVINGVTTDFSKDGFEVSFRCS